MKISVFSDLHLGFGLNTPLEHDSFENAEQALRQSLDCDLIIICGDIFDSRFPRPDTLTKAIKIFSIAQSVETKTLLIKTINKNISCIHKGIPIVALHGTHERVGREQYNAVQLLESACLVYHLHKNGLIFEKDGFKVAIQGMSGVPERYAGDIIEEWSPKPIEGCYNILLLHQNIYPFIQYSSESSSLSIDSLPDGFDLIINGHIHASKIENIGKRKVILPGSTIVTQTKKEEQYDKGVYKISIPEGKISFEKLNGARKFFYEEVEIKDKSVRDCIIPIIEKYKGSYSKKPLLKIKVKHDRLTSIEKEMKNIIELYNDDFIIKYSKEVIHKDDDVKIKILRDARELKTSIDDLGIKILDEILKDAGFDRKIDFLKLYEITSAGDVEKAKQLLIEVIE